MPEVTLVSEATVARCPAGSVLEVREPCIVTPTARELAQRRGVLIRVVDGGGPSTGSARPVADPGRHRGDSIAACIDSTLLAAVATPDHISQLAEEAARLGFAAVCVNPLGVPVAARALRGSRVAVAAVCGFPLGATPSAIKAAEARWAVEQGASEIDMVIPLGLLKAGEWTAVSDDVAAVRAALGHSGTILKAIIEAPLLADSELERAARTVVAAGAQFVKTGTGFSGPALPVHVMKIRQAVGDTARIKAAGGIRDAATARALLEAGADRLGASHAAELLADFARSQG